MDHVSEFEDNAPSLGIDLGLKSVVALSNGFKIAAPKFYRQEEKQLGVFQRRGQKARTPHARAPRLHGQAEAFRRNRSPGGSDQTRQGIDIAGNFRDTPGQARVLGELSTGTLWLSIRLSS
jgi:hypothetical protein